MPGRILAMAIAVLPFGVFADWETNDWMQVSGIAFETYDAGERLDATNGAYYGHWESDVALASAGFASETETGEKFMRLETSSGLSFVADRPGRAGGGNVLLFSVQTMARSSMVDLSPDSKGGFAVAKGEGDAVSFVGWAAGWRELKSDKVSPSVEEAWYDCAMRFRLSDAKTVQVQYLVKGDGGYEVLTLAGGGDGWLDTGIANGDASVSAVDFTGVGGLERLSSREKNGFSVRLR